MGSELSTAKQTVSKHEKKKKRTKQDKSLKSQQLNNTRKTEREKRYDPRDSTLRFVDREDEMDFECNDYKSKRALMSCGHAVTPMSLTNWCRRSLEQGDHKFVCGQVACEVEWSFEEVCKMALLTPKEIEYFESKLFSNAKEYFAVKNCPGCNSSVVRTDPHDLSVKCVMCTAKNNKNFLFCWQCLREWKGPFPRSDRCENRGCIDLLETLRNCPDIIFENVQGVTGCPSIRACPTCGNLVEHDKTKCKNIICPCCKVEFCFVCLNLSIDCKKLTTQSYYQLCPSGVAPRQTSIPVWHSL